MKVTDLRRKLLAALAAGGMLAPSAVYAANLDSNLIANPGFETVDTNVHPPGTEDGDPAFLDPLILNWSGAQGFAYSHNGTGGTFDYANGGPLASGGNYYFTPNAVPNDADPPGDINMPGQMFQNIDVSSGPSRTLIDTGNARYNISAYFNTFETDGDLGHLHLNFLNGSSVSIGTAEVAGRLPLDEWVPNAASGLIPAATRTVQVSVYGTTPIEGGPDGYMDNVDFRVSSAVFQPALAVTINRDTGAVTLSNLTGAGVPIKGYQITSAFEALDPADWRSIADNYDAGNPGPNQVDAAHNWAELTDPAANGDLSEADLESGLGATLANGRVVNLGNTGTWIQNPTEDLRFQYISGTQIVQGVIQFTGHGNVPFASGDLNVDGAITSSDWMILRANQHANLSSQSLAEAYRLGDLNADHKSDFTDFVAFKTLYDAANGAGSFVAMLAAIPEPSTTLLILTAGVFVLPMSLRRSGR